VKATENDQILEFQAEIRGQKIFCKILLQSITDCDSVLHIAMIDRLDGVEVAEKDDETGRENSVFARGGGQFAGPGQGPEPAGDGAGHRG
jgi:hypothetical protein